MSVYITYIVSLEQDVFVEMKPFMHLILHKYFQDIILQQHSSLFQKADNKDSVYNVT